MSLLVHNDIIGHKKRDFCHLEFLILPVSLFLVLQHFQSTLLNIMLRNIRQSFVCALLFGVYEGNHQYQNQSWKACCTVASSFLNLRVVDSKTGISIPATDCYEVSAEKSRFTDVATSDSGNPKSLRSIFLWEGFFSIDDYRREIIKNQDKRYFDCHIPYWFHRFLRNEN